MAKLLGIDYGSKRVGIALSDDGGEMAFPHAVLDNNPDMLKEIKEIIEKEKIEKIVLGESKNFKGEPNEIMKEIEKFKGKLEKETNLKVILEPEFLTSRQAEQVQGKNEMLDSSAATIILQSFLDRPWYN